MTAYSADVRARARSMWLAGGMTDEQIAADLGLPRKDTVRDWRRDEDWGGLRHAVEVATAARLEAQKTAARAKVEQRYDQLAEALEALLIRAMRGISPRGAELRALASAAESMQRIRRTANGLDEPAPPGSANAEVTRRVVFVTAMPRTPASKTPASGTPVTRMSATGTPAGPLPPK